jgi:hypothetical protein
MDRKTVAFPLFACIFSVIDCLIRYEATIGFSYKK